MKRYRLLKDYATPFCFVPAGTVGEKDGGYFSFTSGEDGFSFPADDVRNATDWFEEIKEEADCCYKNPDCPVCPKVQPTEKEECKHEETAGACTKCYQWGFGSGFKKPGPKQKPSEWIEDHLPHPFTGTAQQWQTHQIETIIAFLDEHFSK